MSHTVSARRASTIPGHDGDGLLSAGDHIEAGFRHASAAKAAKAQAEAADDFERTTACAIDAKFHFQESVGHFLAALSDAVEIPDNAQLLIADNVKYLLSCGEEMLMLARQSQAYNDGLPDPYEAAAAPSYDVAEAAKQRNPVLREILQTEERYLAWLKLLVQLYVHPLKHGRGMFRSTVLSHTEFRAMFGSVEQLVPLHNMFLEELRARLGNFTTDPKLGDLFTKFAPFFKLYQPFCNNFEKSAKLIVELTKSRKAFRKFVAECNEKPEAEGHTLQSLLIMPIQRVPRYELLVDTLRKATPEGHPDHPALGEAKDALHRITLSINDTIKKHESRARLYDIAYMFDPPRLNLLAPHRSFVMQAPLRFWRRPTDDDYEQLYGFLFNDIVVFGKRQASGKFTFQRTLKITKVESQVDERHRQNSFTLCGTFDSVHRAYLCSAATPAAKEQWIKAVSSVTEEMAMRVRSLTVAQSRARGAGDGSPIGRSSSFHAPPVHTTAMRRSVSEPGPPAAYSPVTGVDRSLAPVVERNSVRGSTASFASDLADGEGTGDASSDDSDDGCAPPLPVRPSQPAQDLEEAKYSGQGSDEESDEDDEAPPLPDRPSNPEVCGTCSAVQDFDGDATCGQLSVRIGDELSLLDAGFEDWASVQDALGNVGKVPAHVIRLTF